MDAKLGLGTVQFGLPYGIANRGEQLTDRAIADILQVARDTGVAVLDTAAQYGSSEARLGAQDLSGFKIVTKTPVLKGLTQREARDAVLDGTKTSLERLGVSSIDALLVHHAADLLGPIGDDVCRGLEDARRAGMVARIGVSVYDAAEIDTLLSRFEIDVVQLPINVLDQRLLQGGQIAALAARGVEIHTRSAYLQGALLMELDALPAGLQRHRPSFERWRSAAAAQGKTPQQAALAYVRALPGVGCVLVGAVTSRQMDENAAAFAHPGDFDAGGLASEDDTLVDPRRWSPDAGARGAIRK